MAKFKVLLNEEERYALLWTLYRADSKHGIRINKALEEVVEKAKLLGNERRLKEQAEKFLLAYQKEHGGIKIVRGGNPGSHLEPVPLEFQEETPTKRIARHYKLTEEPKLVDPRARRFHLLLVNRFNQFFLPRFAQDALKEQLKKLRDPGPLNQLVNRLRFASRYPGIYPNTCPRRLRLLELLAIRALEEKRGFSARYQNRPETVYFPIQLVRREQVSYLICTTLADTNVQEEMALHRFQVNIQDAGEVNHYPLVKGPQHIHILEPNIKPRIPGNWGTLDELVLEVEGPVAVHLSEMRFHAEEKKARLTTHEFLTRSPTPRVRIQIRNLPYDYELKTWLLGLGAALKSIRAVPAPGHGQVDPLADLMKDINAMHKSLVRADDEVGTTLLPEEA